MAAIARVLARKFPTTQIEVETVKQLALFCGAVLIVSLLMMIYGLDLSLGFLTDFPAQRKVLPLNGVG
jgi:hypothetical protein